jgi:hypothetical protein
MWKTKFLKWAYELNTRLNLADIKFLSGLKQFGKWLVFRVVTSNELMMIRIDGMPFYIHSTFTLRRLLSWNISFNLMSLTRQNSSSVQ